MLKRFLEWIRVKEKIHFHDNKPPFFKEGEMWWVYMGDNVGSEINGKGDKFTRPVVIYKKLCDKIFLAIPVSTKKKSGTWYVPFIQSGINEVALLAQVRVLSYKRLKEKIGEVDESDMSNIISGFNALYSHN